MRSLSGLYVQYNVIVSKAIEETGEKGLGPILLISMFPYAYKLKKTNFNWKNKALGLCLQ